MAGRTPISDHVQLEIAESDSVTESDRFSSVRAAEMTRGHTGIVIPAYFPPGRDHTLGVELLEDTVQACLQVLAAPGSLCVSVDGEDGGKEVAADLHRRLGVAFCVAPHNRGKLHAIRLGLEPLWDRQEFEYFAVVDADGDHLANELVTMMRSALYAGSHTAVNEVLVLGVRTSRHLPMGFLRGELEELADRVLFDALHYHAAQTCQPLRLECVTALEEFPDFHSGYKLFSRGAARATFVEEPRQCGVTDEAYYKHGCESVMTVEALLSGAYLVLVRRTTMNEQPVSAFGLLDRTRLVADKMVWPCRRLGVPAAFVDQWLRNHIPRLLLNTLAPQGREELEKVRELVLAEFGMEPSIDDEGIWGPLFV